MRHLKSALDLSQNFILKAARQKGHLECRYVRRENAKVAVYVSSHYGCNMGCQFCHLTHMGKEHTTMKNASFDDYVTQFRTVLNYTKEEEEKDPSLLVSRINVNFMARGDALANSTIINNYPSLYAR